MKDLAEPILTRIIWIRQERFFTAGSDRYFWWSLIGYNGSVRFDESSLDLPVEVWANNEGKFWVTNHFQSCQYVAERIIRITVMIIFNNINCFSLFIGSKYE